MLDATFTTPDLTTFTGLDTLGLQVTGQFLQPASPGTVLTLTAGSASARMSRSTPTNPSAPCKPGQTCWLPASRRSGGGIRRERLGEGSSPPPPVAKTGSSHLLRSKVDMDAETGLARVIIDGHPLPRRPHSRLPARSARRK